MMSRLILRYYGRAQVDHIDRNKLNNKKSNLRLVSRSKNCYNQVKKNFNNSSKYKCVYFKKDRNKWGVQVSYRIHDTSYRYHKVGFNTELEAAIYANEKMKEFHGKYAVLNEIPVLNTISED